MNGSPLPYNTAKMTNCMPRHGITKIKFDLSQLCPVRLNIVQITEVNLAFIQRENTP